MNKTHRKSIYDRNKQSSKGLLSAGVMIDNDSTTKLLAVKPNRHSLAIFMPKIYGATNPIVTTGIKTQRHFFARPQIEDIASYGGLREPNKIALVVNKFRRLVTVVDTCPPFWSGNLQTKLLGGNHA